MKQGNYARMVLMLCLSFLIMYGVMFLNVYEYGHIYLSATRLYMTLLMVCPMAVLMLVVMGKMYTNKKRNAIILLSSIVVFIFSLVALRRQIMVSDVQYMKAMIPHHSSAILTSSYADIKDPEVRKLADDIIKAQEKEIAQMKEMVARME